VAEVIQVCIPQTGQHYYDYLSPIAVPIGARVKVSFRRQIKVGVVVGSSETSLFQDKLKPIIEVIDPHALIPTPLLALYEWVATYYHAPLADVLHLALPKQFREGRTLTSKTKYKLTNDLEQAPVLHPEQQQAVETISHLLSAYHCFMLQGVTGSGKTEVYLRIIEQVLALGQQVLVLVPEIGLTPQLVERFQARISHPIVVMHSYLNDTERYQAWCAAASAEAAIVLGTRSALFTPMPKLGLIVIDEEHDTSFKQQDGVRYSARDCALIRARQAGVPVILGTATPSLETYHNVQQGKYKHLKLTRKALESTPLHYELVDLRLQPMIEGLAHTTYTKIEAHLSQGHQVLVFVNRRGFAPVLLCHACGWIADCPACERHFTVHQKIQTLICHHCGRQEALRSHCGGCKCQDLISLGVGTQRLYKALMKRFPNVNTAQIDRDELRKKHALEQALQDIATGQTQLMVGTQLIAKGHHFPQLTLVVIVDADAGLYNPDFRALERLGQLLLQVAGRAGRAEHPGTVLIQTHVPQHPLLNVLIQQGYDVFARALLSQRKLAQLPPFMHLSLIRAKGRIPKQVEIFLHQTKKRLSTTSVRIYGPAPSPMPKKAGLYRMQLCFMSPTRQDLHEVLQQLKALPMKGTGVKWSIDVDPVDLG
jgi:primosomal protein N' (replication factor Y)